MGKNKIKYDFINVLKGIAILMVIAVHWNNFFHSPNQILSKIASYGSFGPQLFFIVGSFLLWDKFSKQEHFDPGKFYLHKAKRLLPPYFLSLLLTIFIIEKNEFDFISIITHFSLTNFLFPNHLNNILGVEWYVEDYIIFIALAPLLKKLIHSLNTSFIFLIIGLIVSFIFNCFFVFNYNIGEGYNVDSYFTVFAFPIQFPIIMLGILIYYLREQYTNHSITYFQIFKIFLFLIIFTTIVYVATRNLFIPVITISFLFGSYWGLVFIVFEKLYSLKHKTNSIINIIVSFGKIFESFGKKSYGIYLIHILVIRGFYYYNEFFMFQNSWNWIGMFLIISIISYIAGKYFEKLSYKIIDIAVYFQKNFILYFNFFKLKK